MADSRNYTINQKTVRRSRIKDLEGTSNHVKYLVVLFYVMFILVSAFYFNSIGEIISGMGRIIVAPSILVSDYMAIGNIGSTLLNSGLTMIIAIVIAKMNDVEMNGPVIAAIFTIGGFALFGKNIYNMWSIFLGVYLYAIVQKEKFNKFITVAFFGTALGPLVSQISFGLGLPVLQGIALGNICGVLAGFIMPPLAAHFSKFHQGFNLYNMGFTCGIIGSLFMSVLRAYGKNHETLAIVSNGNNSIFTIYLLMLFTLMILTGYRLNNKSFVGYKKLIKRSGRAATDFVTLDGFGLTMVNMGLTGLMGTGYVLLVNGELNGPTIGGIITIAAFGAYGKHIKNIWPIFLGIFLASFTQIWDMNATGVLLAALFGTTLAPVAGEYGWKVGVIAGFIHISLVMNTGYLHGGMNLYNNGFSGGIVAAALIPIVDSLVKKHE